VARRHADARPDLGSLAGPRRRAADDLDQSHIDMAVLAMTSTGVQQFEVDEAAAHC